MNAELPQSSGHPLEKTIAAYGDAWNRHDIDAILALHAEDLVFENHTSGGKGVGKDAIRQILKGSLPHSRTCASKRAVLMCATD